MCQSAVDEAERTGLVYRCEGRPGHTCSGPRAPYHWKARGGRGDPFESEQPCCGSCASDDEYGDTWRGEDEACCCVHRQEWDKEHTAHL